MRALLLLGLLLASGARAQDFSAVDALLADSLAQIGGGAALLVVHDGEVVHRAAYGSFTTETAVPIASATKWLSGALIASLLSDGTLTVADSLAMFVPTLEGEIRGVTVGQLFSHTSGLPGGSGLAAPLCLSNPLTTLGACTRSVLEDGLTISPGAGFAYGGASMHVAGHIAEIATGERWVDLFEARIAGPLGMTATTWNTAFNPRIAGGATSTIDDYGAFLQMLLAEGVYDGQRVLTPEAIGAMLADQTDGAPILESPYERYAAQYPELPPVDEIRYGLGVWREGVAEDGSLRVASSPGAFGTAPWIDLEARLGAVLLVEDRLPDAFGTYLALQQLVREAVGAPVAVEPQMESPGLRVEAPHPNPARHRTTVRVTLPETSRLTASVVDALGRRVAVLADERLSAGEHRLALDTRTLAPGVYRVVARAGAETASRALVVVR